MSKAGHSTRQDDRGAVISKSKDRAYLEYRAGVERVRAAEALNPDIVRLHKQFADFYDQACLALDVAERAIFSAAGVGDDEDSSRRTLQSRPASLDRV